MKTKREWLLDRLAWYVPLIIGILLVMVLDRLSDEITPWWVLGEWAVIWLILEAIRFYFHNRAYKKKQAVIEARFAEIRKLRDTLK